MRHFLFLMTLCFVQATSAQNLLLKNATIIDGDASQPVRTASILIKDGKIEKIAADIKPRKKDAVTVIDCEGKYITPGLIDAHVHLGNLDLRANAKARATTDSVLFNMVRHGITTVRDMAGNAPFLQSYQNAFGKGKPSPQIFYAAQFAGPSYFKMLGAGRSGEQSGITPWERAITDTTNIEKAVLEAKAAGVTGIKIYADLSKKQINDITRAAYKHGLMAWSHAAVFPEKPIVVAEAGVTSMSHANDLVFQQIPGDTLEIGKAWEAVYKGLKAENQHIDPLLLTMKKNGIYLDPTLFHAGNNNMVNAEIISKRAHELGVKFVTGTDWPNPSGNEPVPLMDEFKLLIEKVGLSPREVLEAATKNGALVTGLKDRGVIKKGMRADLLILGQNPLENFEVFFTPEMVIQQGRVVVGL